MNIIFIVADDLGWGDVGYHNPEALTPNIDELAVKGTRFENFYVQGSCSPTRAAFMTGIYPYKLGMQRVLWPWNTHGLNKKMIPYYFKKHGFETAIFGKWNLGHSKKEYLPLANGFDYHYGSYTGSMDHLNHTYYGVHDLNENEKSVYDQGHIADLITNKVIQKIKLRDKNKNFFYYIPYNSPHAPIQFPPYFKNVFEKMQDKRRADYLSMVYHLDTCIGRVIDILKKEKLLEDTLIWFSSDNGGWLDSGSSNGSLSGGKANQEKLGFGEGSMKAVNFLYYEPWNKSIIHKGLFHAIDILPTLCHINEIELEEEVDGINITPFLYSKMENRTIIHSIMGNDKSSIFGACRKNEMKYICCGEKVQVYNIDEDKNETNDLHGKIPIEAESELRNILEKSFEKYIPDPLMWTQPNGYPDGFVFPKDWNSNLNDQQLSALSFSKHTFDLEKQSIIEIIGYYNLLN